MVNLVSIKRSSQEPVFCSPTQFEGTCALGRRTLAAADDSIWTLRLIAVVTLNSTKRSKRAC